MVRVKDLPMTDEKKPPQGADDGLGLLLEAAPSAELTEALGWLRQMAADVSYLANAQRRSAADAGWSVHVSKAGSRDMTPANSPSVKDENHPQSQMNSAPGGKEEQE